MKVREMREALARNISNKKRKLTKSVAVVTAATLLAGGTPVCYVNAQKADQTQNQEQSDAEDGEELLTKVIDAQTSSDNKDVDKDETVYVISDAKGNATNVIVSDWLKNKNGAAKLEDESTLKDIENVKGDETYRAGSGDSITWDAQGSDIYYQGTTDQGVPVTLKLTYTLDGKEISPEELAGKSGHVTICFDYTNNEKRTVTINDKQEEISVPFTVISGALLSTDHFKNVTVENGRVISEGNHDIVIGLAFPGLKESLSIDEDELDKEVNIPEHVLVEADATDFELDMTMTMIMSDVLNDVSLTDDIDLDELNSSMDDLQDGADKLVEGSTELDDGVGTLYDKSGELKDGTDKMSDGVMRYTDGVGQLAEGIGSLKEGTGKLNASIPDLTKGVGDLKNGSASAKDGADQLVAGYAGTKEKQGAAGGAKSLASGAKELAGGAKDLADGADQLASGAKELESGVGTLSSGAGTLSDSSQALAKGAQGVADGAAGVSQGLTALQSGLNSMFGGLSANIQTYTAAQQNAEASLEASQAVMAADLTALYGKITEAETLSGQLAAAQAVSDNTTAATLKTQLDAVNEEIGVLIQQTILADAAGIGESSGAYGGAKGAVTALTAISDQAAAANLTDNVGALVNGAGQVADGAAQVAKGASDLSDGAAQLSAGTNQLLAGASSLSSGAGELSSGAGTLSSGASQVATGADSLNKGINGYTNENGKKVTGLYDGTKSLLKGLGQLDDGLGELNKSSKDLAEGVGELDSGAAKLNEGVKTLNGNSADLNSGASELSKGAGLLIDGVKELKDGSGELKDGMITFNEDGIKKLADALGDDLQTLVDRIDAVKEAGEGYTTFSGARSGAKSSVKFIIKTDGVK